MRTEVQRAQTTCSKSHSYKVMEQSLNENPVLSNPVALFNFTPTITFLKKVGAQVYQIKHLETCGFTKMHIHVRVYSTIFPCLL